MLETERFRRVSQVFAEALRTPAGERDRYIDEASGDVSIAAEVRRLLEADESGAGAFLDTPPAGALLDSDRAAPGEGDQVGRYTIVRMLGSGGMGVVYAAEQASPRREVALKMIAPGLVAPSALARFQREAEALGRLEHAGIARIYEAGEADGRPFFAMELVRGRPAIEHADAVSMGIRERLELAAQIADAVQHAHQKGVIHRDLKPANVLVQADGLPKVLDFGVSALTDAKGVGQTIDAASRRVVGTLASMSPEQASGGERDVDTRTDVYALGVLTYQLLSGCMPIDVSDRPIAAALRAVIEEPPVRLSVHDTAMRGDVETVVHTALSKDPSARYASAAGFAADLRRVVRDEAIAARPTSTLYQLRKLARRNRVGVAAGAAALFALAGATAVSVLFGVNAHRAETEAVAALDVAEQRLSDVRRVANALLFDIDRELDGVAGATAARENLVRLGLEYMDKVVESSGDDPDVLGELARGYLRLGDVYGSIGGGSLRDTGKAIEVYERALAIYSRLVEADPDDKRARVFYSVACKLAGQSAAAAGDVERGHALFGDALGMASESVDRFPEDYVLRRDLGLTHAGLADILERQGRWDDTLVQFQTSREVLRVAMSLATPEQRPRAERDLQSVETDTATILGKLGRVEEALQIGMGPLTARRAAAEASPNSAAAQSRLGASLGQMGRLLMRAERFGAALELYEEALGVYVGLVERDPDDRSSRFWRTTTLENVGDALHRLGRSSEARERYQTCRALRETLVRENPADVDFARALALAIERVADMDAALGDDAAARAGYTDAAQRAYAVYERSPGDSLSEEIAMVTAYKAGSALLGASAGVPPVDRGEARRLLERAASLEAEMSRQGRGRANTRVSAEAIADALARLDR